MMSQLKRSYSYLCGREEGRHRVAGLFRPRVKASARAAVLPVPGGLTVMTTMLLLMYDSSCSGGYVPAPFGGRAPWGPGCGIDLASR